MGFWQRIWQRIIPSGVIAERVEEEFEKALTARKRTPQRIDDDRARHLPLYLYAEPGGQGPRKLLGLPYEILRVFARNNPWLRAAIDIRKREIAAAQWDVVPALERHKAELDALRCLSLSAVRYPDRRDLLRKARATYVTPSVWSALRFALDTEDISEAEIRDRCMLALFDITREAEQHAHCVRQLFLHPNRNRKPWDQILRAVVPDILTLDAGCVELRRAEYPHDTEGHPRPDNPILELHWVDGATVRPCIDEHGQLRGINNPQEPAYEQWIDNQKVPEAQWRVGDLLYIQENPQTDVRFRGYGYSRVETLAMTSMLEAMADKEDLEELKRGMYGGFLNIKDESVVMEDVSALRSMVEEQWEGTKKIPLVAFDDLQWVPTTMSDAGRDKKSVERRKQMALRVCAVMNMPPTKLGILEDVNRATSEGQTDIADDGLRELMDLLDEALNEGIVRPFGYADIAYRSNVSHLRDEPEKLEADGKRLELMLASPNEIRSERGDPPLENGDMSLEYLKAFAQAKGQNDGGGGKGQDEGEPPQDGEEGEGEEDKKNLPEDEIEKALGLFRTALVEHRERYGGVPEIKIALE